MLSHLPLEILVCNFHVQGETNVGFRCWPKYCDVTLWRNKHFDVTIVVMKRELAVEDKSLRDRFLAKIVFKLSSNTLRVSHLCQSKRSLGTSGSISFASKTDNLDIVFTTSYPYATNRRKKVMKKD